ncbi:uncharacterized protein F5Z01DRAFT_628351 [Emericellopsis atlantica]|uniref:N-acetylgalactosaminide beta-1,3-galactosyltransferase n=1 Tax=Emericellopsis atlantica TaxID=2614577 RepID=A0A9P8CL53_9HYPO|nr:uncharacterized protein F5Z01DRAFT_628351 [Emericellopsis atlantica]KAG9251038.1 hypothetical protein F5Z01DRAFT_628351 [Emericellopsis atlantica]
MAFKSQNAATPTISLRALALNKRFTRIVILAAVALLIILVITLHNAHSDELHLPPDIYASTTSSLVALVPAFLKSDPPPEYYPFSTTSRFRPVSVQNPSAKSKDALCATFPKHLLGSVQPVLKMGHGEDKAKIEAQLDSVSACFDKDELLIFSDLEETIHVHEVIDVLADLPEIYYADDNPDLMNYVWLKEMKANGTLDKDKEAMGKINGWILDKYKFLPMVERAVMMKPDRDFYFFFETDTYVFWDNAFRFLQTFDPEVPLYMGSPSPGRVVEDKRIKTFFANGGPGFVLSRGSIKALLHRETDAAGQYIEPPLLEKWLPDLRGECCGDSIMGWSLWDIGIPLHGYWPHFNPHPAHGIPFSDLYWCQPPITLHKTKPDDMRDLWKWEFGERQLGRPLLYADLWRFHHPGDPSVKDNWDNGDWDGWLAPPEASIDSFDACGDYCKSFDNCVQWSWRGGQEKKCIAMRSIRYGDKPTRSVDDPQQEIKAGWVSERVQQFRDDRQCPVVQWEKASVRRIF